MANRGGSSAVEAQKKFLRWAFGSNFNSFRQPELCGETVGGEFLLAVSFAPGSKVNCVIPRGLPILGSPGGSVVVVPFDAPTPAGLQAALDDAGVSDPVAVLDGKSLAKDVKFARTGAYTMAVAKNGTLREFYPDFPASLKKVTVASLAWTVRIPPLAKGSHTLVLSDKLDGETFDITFNIRVR